MGWITSAFASAFLLGQTPAAPATEIAAHPAPVVVHEATPGQNYGQVTVLGESCSDRKLFESDHAFDNFIAPISSPIYSKDPRSMTEIRGLYIRNWIPRDSALSGGNFDAMAAQIRVALTERLTFIADKDGYLFLRPDNRQIRNRDGFLNLAAGLKYTFWRDCETQTLAAAGFMYELPTGERDVFQNGGNGIVTPFVTFAKEMPDNWHIMGNVAHSTGLRQSANSSFLFTQLHIDKGINCWLYPLFEVNWYHYTRGGNALPFVIGEGDGLVNLGTQGMAGKNMVTIAPGLKAKVNKHLEYGFVYERSITGRKDLLDHRFIGELILRY